MIEAPNPASVANDHFQIIVTGLVAVFVALVPLFIVLVQTQKKASRAVDQLENNHKHPDGSVINLREEADARHDENAKKLDRVIEIVLGMQGDIRNLYTNDTQARAQLEELERTIDRRPKP